MEAAIIKFKNHPSIKLIKHTFKIAGATLPFQYASLDETSKEIDKPNSEKAI